ncbi:MAG: hypothetical protein NAOJABEB_03333 [Steroidobacteraceae bacterium]|nr:hypothetical protein [Steroidobacteraceae bacterium]
MPRQYKRIPPAQRFWKHVDTSSDCWLWTGYRLPAGYGYIGPSIRGEKHQLAHRVSYELANGPIPDGLVIDHLCRNPPCVNPAHLEAVTHQQNTLRGNAPSAKLALQTHCKRGHELTEDNIYRDPSHPNQRNCRICRRIRSREYKARKRIGQ